MKSARFFLILNTHKHNQVCHNLVAGGRIVISADGVASASDSSALDGLQEDGLTLSAALAQGRSASLVPEQKSEYPSNDEILTEEDRSFWHLLQSSFSLDLKMFWLALASFTDHGPWLTN